MIANISQPDQHTTVIKFLGKLMFNARQTFQSVMTQAEEASPQHIILDFSDLSYIDSAGLGLLTLAHRKLSEQGYKLGIANAQGSVRDILLLTNMNKMFHLSDSAKTASQTSKTMSLPPR